jgi:ABC-type multidrug transport system ATPase subunit
MVAIGRALMAQPKLLLLDEPSLGLAPTIVLDMFDAIRRIHAEGIAVLLVEQNVAHGTGRGPARGRAGRGRIVALGRPDELMARPELRRAYLGLEEAECAGATPGATARGAASGRGRRSAIHQSSAALIAQLTASISSAVLATPGDRPSVSRPSDQGSPPAMATSMPTSLSGTSAIARMHTTPETV